MQPEQQQRIMGYFIEEAKDHLSTIEQGLLNLQSTMEDPEMVNELFRAAHSVKGGAAMLGLNSIMRVAHRLEDFFKLLKESSIRVDQKLETLFLQVFDGLQELLGQLQGPFGLTDEVATSVLSGVEPVFEQLEHHLAKLSGSATKLPAAPTGAAGRTPQQMATTPSFQQENQLALFFGREVPVYLRDMLQLFKQVENSTTRQQLEEICKNLLKGGQHLNLPTWSYLIELARQAIANPENSYRTLALLVIKDIKQAQDFALAGRLAEISACEQLQALVPVVSEPEIAADSDLGDFLGTLDFTEFGDEAEFDIAASEQTPLPAIEQLSISSSLHLDDEFEDVFSGTETLDHTGPEMGMAELNSLADLFEGEVPDLASTWQDEEILSSPSDVFATSPGSTLSDADFSDFSDLLFDETETTPFPTFTSEDDLSALFGDDLFGEDSGDMKLDTLEQSISSIRADDLEENDLRETLDFSANSETSEFNANEFSFDLEIAELDNMPNDLGLDLINQAESLDLDLDLEQSSAPETSLNGLGDLFAGMDETDFSFTEPPLPAATPFTPDDISAFHNFPESETDLTITEDELNAFADLWTESSEFSEGNQPEQARTNDLAFEQHQTLDPWEEAEQNIQEGTDSLNLGSLDLLDFSAYDELSVNSVESSSSIERGSAPGTEESILDLGELTTEGNIPIADFSSDLSNDFVELTDSASLEFSEPSLSAEASLNLADLQLEDSSAIAEAPELMMTGDESLGWDEALLTTGEESLDFGDLELEETLAVTETSEFTFPGEESLDFSNLQLEDSSAIADAPELTMTGDESLGWDEALLTTGEESLDFGDLELEETLAVTETSEFTFPGEESLDFSNLQLEDSSASAETSEFTFPGEEALGFGYGDLPLEESSAVTDVPELTSTDADSLNLDKELLTPAEESLDFGDLQEEATPTIPEVSEFTLSEEDLLSFDASLFDETFPDHELDDLSLSNETSLDFIEQQGDEPPTEGSSFSLSSEDSLDFGELQLEEPSAIANVPESTTDQDSLDFGELQLEEPSAIADAPEMTTTDEDSLNLDEVLFTSDADSLNFDDAWFNDEVALDEASTDKELEGLTSINEASLDVGNELLELGDLSQTDTFVPSDINEADLELTGLDDLLNEAPASRTDDDLTTLNAWMSETTSPLAESSEMDRLSGEELDTGITDDANDLDSWLDQESTSSYFDVLLNEEQETSTVESMDDLNSLLEQEFTVASGDNQDDLEHLLGQEATSETDDFASLEDLLSEEDFKTANDFADLDNLLSAELTDAASMASPQTADVSLETNLSDDFADLEALLGEDTSSEAIASWPVGEATEHESEFDELDELLKDAEEKMGGTPTMKVSRGAAPQTRRPTRQGRVFSGQTMRVPVKHLDNLSNLVGELVVNRNSLEQDQERLRQSLDNLLYQVQQLSDVGQRMQDLYERSLLESSLLASRHGHRNHLAAGFSHHTRHGDSHPDPDHASGVEYDPLEMDRFTGFHSLSQEMIELIVRVRESASDIEFIVDETDQVTRMFRQVTTQLQEGLTRSRMVPFAQTADRLPRAVRDISIKVGKQAELHIEGRETLIDKMILEQLYDPMTHLVSNALTHGIESPEVRRAANKPPAGRITVRAFHQGNQTIISVSDDGAGIDVERVKAKAIEKGLITPSEARSMSRLDVYDLLFHAGFTTKDQADDFSGRGVGMDVVRTSLSEIRGAITTDSTPGKGTTFTIRLPLTLSISKALCCISDRARIAFPMDGVEDMLDVPKDRIQTNAEGQSCISWRDSLLPLRPLTELLGYNRQLSRGSVYGGSQEDDIVSIVVLRSAGNFLALQVDQVLGEQEIVIKQLEGPVPKPVGIAGATVLGDGRIMPIADVLELIDLSMGRIRKDTGGSLWEQSGGQIGQETPVVKTEPMVLIIDDSITVRELLSMTFNKVGYRVEQARDGQEAWEKLRSGLPCDIVFCDIEMPRMDGLELLSRIQKDVNLSHLPIAMLTSRGADRHRQMAASLGASGYFTKPYLEEALLDAAQRMLKGEKLINSGH